MNNPRILATLSLAVVSAVASAQTAQTSASQTTLVTVENYNRAQTDVNFAGVVKNGGFGKFRHGRELARYGGADHSGLCSGPRRLRLL